MKTRTGFVSNSSSSSFVIRRSEWESKGKKTVRVGVLTKEQESKLKKFGFRKTVAHSPEQVPDFCDAAAWKKEVKWVKTGTWCRGDWNWGYEITCNQDGVMVFLIENKIPFVASCHYGHESYVYVPWNDTLFQGTNFGRLIETYGPADYGLDKRQRTGIKMFKGKEWVKKNKW